MADPNEDDIVVTQEHAVHFGFIINIFAKIELQMMIAAAGLLDSDLGTAVILMGDMNYRTKRQTLNHLNTTIGVEGNVDRRLTEILNDLDAMSSLRNSIAHSTWTTAQRPGAIKPMQLNIRAPVPKPLGHHHNEKSYTAVELRAEAIKLNCIHGRFVDFLAESGLQAKVAVKIEATKPRNSSSEGSPSAK